MRITDQSQFQLASRTYYLEKDSSAKIQLLPMVHIGHHEFYVLVQRILDKSNAILFENVHNDDNFIVEKIGPQFFTMPQVQCRKLLDLMGGFGNTALDLGLSMQSDYISYPSGRSKNIDASYAQIFARDIQRQGSRKLIEQHGWQNLDLCAQVLAVSVQESIDRGMTKAVDIDRLLAQSNAEFKQWLATKRTTPGPPSKLTKQKFAETLMASHLDPSGMDEQDRETFMRYRNEVALQHVQANYIQRPGVTTIIYGANHMPEIEAGIIKMGYIPEKEEWLTVFRF